MKPLSLFIFFYCSLLFFGCENSMPKSQPANLDWDIELVTSYGFYGLNEMDKLSEKDLGEQDSVRITDSRLSHLFSRASFSDKWVLWKGGKLAFVNLKDGSKVKLKISNYGNFFFIAGKKGFYFFENEEDKKLWDYLFFGEGLKKQVRERGSN